MTLTNQGSYWHMAGCRRYRLLDLMSYVIMNASPRPWTRLYGPFCATMWYALGVFGSLVRNTSGIAEIFVSVVDM